MLTRLICAVLLLLSTALHAEPAGFRAYELGKHGSLQLTVPHSWNDQIRQRQGDAPPTILFTPEQGNGFNIQVTPLWPSTPDAALPDAEQIKNTVSKAAEDTRSQVVETAIPIQDIEGAAGSGSYFRVTDRAPAPSDFRYKTQGMLRAGKLVVAFIILSNDGAEPAVADALKMLKSAQQVVATLH